MDKRTFIGERKKSHRSKQPSRRTKPNMSDITESVGLEQALAVFVRAKEAERVRPATIRNYMSHINYLIDYLTEYKNEPNPMLEDLTPSLIRDYIHYMLHERVRYRDDRGRKDKTAGLSPHTVNIRLRTLRTMSRFWTSENIIGADFMANIEPVMIDEPDEIKGLSDAEINLLLNSYDMTQFAEYRDVILIYLLLDTGLRISEAVGLTIDRVDFKLLTVYVPSRIAKNRRNREVPISKQIAEKLRELYEESIGYFGESDTIFFNAYGDPFSADAFRKRLNRRKHRLDMKRLSPHMFRHTFGRNYLLNGGDIATLQRILDHADIETTRQYATVDYSDMQAQHNRYSPINRIMKRRR